MALRVKAYAGTKVEQEAVARLVRLTTSHKLNRWLFTEEVMIHERVRPHSHPVLTLSARRLNDAVGDDDWLLAMFLHEQFHWFVSRYPGAETAARAELEHAFPKAPVGSPLGAKDAYSTYLHLIICWLEYGALSHLLGRERARHTLTSMAGYSWIYRQVFNDAGTIQAILQRHGLHLP